MAKDIEHKGIVQEIKGNRIKVDILNKSMCSACHAKSVCMLADEKTKTIDVDYKGLDTFVIGEEVLVTLRREMGFRAVLISYVYPLIILIVLLLSLSGLLQNDLYSGLISLAGVVIYYLGVYFFEGKTKKKIVFTIEKKYK